MVWPTTNQANNFDNSFFQGFIDVSGGDIINRNGGIYAIDGSGIFQDLLVNTINEKITNTGVTIDSVLLKDNNVTAHTISAQNYSVGNVNFISASRQGNFRDLEVKDTNNNATILLMGDGGDINIDGTLSTDIISEKTSGTGVTIDSVLLKDSNVTAHTISAQNYSVGNVNFISASRQGNFRDLEVKDTNNNATILLVGDGGNMDLLGIIDITGKSIMRSDLSLNGNITTNGFVHQF